MSSDSTFDLSEVPTFRTLEVGDLPILKKWFDEEHVAEWWDVAPYLDDFIGKMREKLSDRNLHPSIVLLGDRPVGYVQVYDAHASSLEGDGWWKDVAPGTFGIDLFIGELELLGRGLGTRMIQEMVARLFERPEVIAVIADPAPENLRAHRAYEKAGFTKVGPINTPDGEAILFRVAPPEAVEEVLETAKYERAVVRVGETTFLLYGRDPSLPGAIGLVRLRKNLARIWNAFIELPREDIPIAYILDVDAPIGGGPIGSFAIGIYSAQNVASEVQSFVKDTLGWEGESSTQKYIDRHYAGFSDPTEGYVDDMLTHELGHLFFGFGRTVETSSPFYHSWFSLGVGLLYDRLAWDRVGEKASPLFLAVEKIYSEKFAKLRTLLTS